MFKILRIFILLVILTGVAWAAWQAKTRSVSWQQVLPVNIYLLNGDGSQHTANYLKGINADEFKPIEKFMKDEAFRYGRNTSASIEIRMAGILDELPPEPPAAGGMLQAVWWSMRMRWWAYSHAKYKGPGPQVRLLLLYFDPAKHSKLRHSTGLQKGLLGRVNVFAAQDMASQNNVVIAHEFLHTLGASDKYDPFSNQPVYPEGYAIPKQVPLLPQHYAEIMAGRTPLTQSTAEIPDSLEETLIGEKTAREINWLQ